MEKIYISDLDGTLLNDAPALSDYSRRKINELLDAGVNFTVASARNLASLQQILGDIAFKLPVIEINGAYISDYHTGEHIVINEIQTDICSSLIEVCDELGCMPFISAHDKGKDRLYYEGVSNDGMIWFLGDKTEGHSKHAHQVESLQHILEEQIVCFTMIGPFDVMNKLNDWIQTRFASELDIFFFSNPYSPDWYWITIHDKRAKKDIAIQKLISIYGFDLSQLVVFGDQINDVSMMQLNNLGATSIAPSNAIDEVKQAANKVIGTNQQDSVVKFILENESFHL